MRDWSIELRLLHAETGEELPATCFEKVTYHLHETFGKRAKQNKSKPPFRVEEEGWGEFDLTIVPTQVGKGDLDALMHDLNFREARYESRHEVVSLDVLRTFAVSGYSASMYTTASGCDFRY